MLKIETLLKLIGAKSRLPISTIIYKLGNDKPRGRDAWTDFYDTLRAADQAGLIELRRNFMGEFESAALTEVGVERLKQSLIVAECDAVADNNDIPAREAAQSQYQSILDEENAREIMESL